MSRKRFRYDEATGRIIDRQPTGIHDLGGDTPFEKYLRVKLDIAWRVAESVALFGWNVTIPDRNPMPRIRIWGRR